MSNYMNDFRNLLLLDAARVFARYPSFWNDDLYKQEFTQNVMRIIPGLHLDAAALLAHYKSEARSKDAARIFIAAMRECIIHHGYTPESVNYMMVWNFLIVKLTEYDDAVRITEHTDIQGMFDCYCNTGEIDYEHDWTT